MKRKVDSNSNLQQQSKLRTESPVILQHLRKAATKGKLTLADGLELEVSIPQPCF